MPRRPIGRGRNGVVDDVHHPESLRSLFEGAGNCPKTLARFFDELTGVVHDPPSPERILRGRERHDLHGASLPPAPTAPTTASATAQARGLGELDLERAPVELLAVELLDGRLGLRGRGHLDESKAA